MPKDYSLSSAAVAEGTDNPQWFHPSVDPAAIRMLMQKSDKIALRDTLIWLGALCLSGVIAVALWPTWWSVQLGSILPLMLVGLSRIYGAWHHVMTGLLQHLGLAENVSDHRQNTRTVLMNPVSRFIYLNMNYHLEHHMFTMVPYYNLPRLHDLIKHDGRAQQLLWPRTLPRSAP